MLYLHGKCSLFFSICVGSDTKLLKTTSDFPNPQI